MLTHLQCKFVNPAQVLKTIAALIYTIKFKLKKMLVHVVKVINEVILKVQIKYVLAIVPLIQFYQMQEGVETIESGILF